MRAAPHYHHHYQAVQQAAPVPAAGQLLSAALAAEAANKKNTAPPPTTLPPLLSAAALGLHHSPHSAAHHLIHNFINSSRSTHEAMSPLGCRWYQPTAGDLQEKPAAVTLPQHDDKKTTVLQLLLLLQLQSSKNIAHTGPHTLFISPWAALGAPLALAPLLAASPWGCLPVWGQAGALQAASRQAGVSRRWSGQVKLGASQRI